MFWRRDVPFSQFKKCMHVDCLLLLAARVCILLYIFYFNNNFLQLLLNVDKNLTNFWQPVRYIENCQVFQEIFNFTYKRIFLKLIPTLVKLLLLLCINQICTICLWRSFFIGFIQLCGDFLWLAVHLFSPG